MSKHQDDSIETIHHNEVAHNEQLMEEHILSQRMSQLSATATNETEFIVKDIKNIVEKIPNYLTKQNKSFEQLLDQALSTLTLETLNVGRDELRKIAILIYKTILIQIYLRLWTVYLRSGMGRLINQSCQQPLIYPTDLRIWPKEIKTIVKSSKTNKTNENDTCMCFVKDYIHELNKQLKQYQIELNIKINNCKCYTPVLGEILEKYIKENLSSLNLEIDHKIEIIQYDYQIQALKIEYQRQKPTATQELKMKQLCHSKYEEETTQQEFDFLRKQMDYYNSPSQAFKYSPIAESTLINSIENPTIRKQIFNQYKDIAMQARAQLFALYLKTAKEQKDEFKRKYNADINKLWSDQRGHIENEKLSSIMLNLLNERCNKISERIKSIYKFKIQSIPAT
ncbi:unnamed protein product [Rotaria sordida]|uniref:Uncharacterized protein n=1 Tax=Rotaria sordida TaxID=392033 RepID=A0A815PJC1_9BILA|nr:unnamed protein product [Rotaria sordida]CAF1449659.1 unnamed protein product [Rotaria sordida]CAF3871861.1 unnamed protein product [Rotaria sordida]CAF3878610.1 unnamed protein product [Rotaria sordida]